MMSSKILLMDSSDLSLTPLELCPIDLWSALLSEINCVATMIILCQTSKTCKQRVARFAIMNQIIFCHNYENMAAKGHLNVLKWANELGRCWNLSNIGELAAFYGHL